MVNIEILEGLRLAVSMGEPLRQAMMSFYNSGYKKEEIEEAARSLNMPPPIQQIQPSIQPQPSQIPKTKQTKPPQQIQPPVQQPTQPQQIYQPQQIPIQLQPIYQSQQTTQIPIPAPLGVIQRVSGYEQKPKLSGVVITVILVFFLLFFLGVLTAVFLFKEDFTSFFGGLV